MSGAMTALPVRHHGVSRENFLIIIIIIIIIVLSLVTYLSLSGTYPEPTVILTSQCSSFTLQYFPYYV